jgi:hypothetical protein
MQICLVVLLVIAAVPILAVWGGLFTLYYFGFGLIGATAGLSTLVIISSVSQILRSEWRRQRVQELLMTPLSNRDLVVGLLGGRLATWILWLAFACVVSLPLLFLGRLGESPLLPRTTAGHDLLVWAGFCFYGVTQSLWAVAITFEFATRWRSATAIQFMAIFILIVVTPALLWIWLRLTSDALSDEFVAVLIAFLIPQILKVCIAAPMIRQSLAGFQERLLRLLERSEWVRE